MSERSVRVALAIVVVAAGCAGAPSGGPQRPSAAGVAPTTAAPACEGCHAAIAAEWQASFHRSAFVDSTFQSSLDLERPQEHAFCNGCHAPAATRSGAGAAAGVDCVSCHGDAAHDRKQAKVAASSCATCHEFTFGDGRPELVQKTLSEHAASAFAEVSCTQCHMPESEGHKDHRFLSGHAPERIARAVHVEVASVAAASALRVRIRVDAGHAFPTGDMFRRARLVVFAEGARGEIVADAERTFGRTWTGVRAGTHAGARTQESDTRIRGSWEGVVELETPTAPIARVRWTLLYERVVAMQGAHVSVASSDAVAEGELAWPR